MGKLVLKVLTAAALGLAVLSVLAAVGYLVVFVVRVMSGYHFDRNDLWFDAP